MTKGTCQTCGATAPLEWFLTSTLDKQAMQICTRMPRELADVALYYLGLFRPASGRALTPKKTLRLVTELAGLVGTGYVQIDKEPARPCSAVTWAKAIEEMLASKSIKPPLPNHNYLRQVAYGLADSEDKKQEGIIRQSETSGNYRALKIKRSALDIMVHGEGENNAK